MKFFIILAFLFLLGSALGWCVEFLFRNFFSKSNKGHKWINPGFLTGPYLPIYGVGMCILFIMSTFDSCPVFKYSSNNKLLLFLSMGICMTAIEYITGVVLIKGMKVRLWDYSGKRYNVQGIICLQFSIIWVVAGGLYYYLVHPNILNALYWLSQNLAFSFFIGIFFGFFIVDLVYSTQILSKIKEFAVDKNIIVKYEELKEHVAESKEKKYERLIFIFKRLSKTQIIEHLGRYYEKQKEKIIEGVSSKGRR